MTGLADDVNLDHSHFKLSAKMAVADSDVNCDFLNERC